LLPHRRKTTTAMQSTLVRVDVATKNTTNGVTKQGLEE